MEKKTKEELQNLALERETVRIKENSLIDEVKKLEDYILDQERKIR